MKKIVLTTFLLLSANIPLLSQIGINTSTPTATLDVVGKPTDTAIADGLTAPRIKRSELIKKNSKYGTNQTGTMVYVYDISGNPDSTSKAIDITAMGYYFFNGTKWLKLTPEVPAISASNGLIIESGNIQFGGTLVKPTTIEQGANSLSFINSAMNPAGNKVGIGRTNPNSTLAVKGSFEAAYKEVNSNYTLTADDYYLTYSGSTAGTITLPVIGTTSTSSFTGRVYRIKNISTANLILVASPGNTIRPDSQSVSSFNLTPGSYVEVISNANTSGSTWDLSFIGQPVVSNVEVYGNQLKIPPFATNISNHNITTYDTPATSNDSAWHIVSTSTTPFSILYETGRKYVNSSSMIIIYEYQGTPFNINNMYPILTAGNNAGYPDIFTASFISLLNNGTGGKTRLKVSVSRIDFIGNNGTNNSNWIGTFLLNLLLARKNN